MAEYSAEQADNVVFSKENGEQPTEKEIVLDKYYTAIDDGSATATYYTRNDQGAIVSVFDQKQLYAMTGYSFSDHQITRLIADGLKTEYTLNDQNLIIKSEVYNDDKLISTTTYEYDSKGRLISKSEDYDNSNTLLTWNDDDDLVKIETCKVGGDMETEIVTPSELSVDHPHPLPFLTSLDNALFMQGYYGKASKHLIASTVPDSGTPIGLKMTDEYSYTITNGRITGIENHSISEITILGYKSESTTTYTYVWKEL